jgi:hypothetical protein
MRALLPLIARFRAFALPNFACPTRTSARRSVKRSQHRGAPREMATNPLCRALVTMIASGSRNVQVSPLLLLLLLCALLLLLLLSKP